MEELCKEFVALLDAPEDYLRPSNKLQLWINQTKNIYNFVKKEEGKYALPASSEALSELSTEGLDTEQIWQVLELQNKSLLAAPDDLEGLDDVNLCYNVAKLSSLANYGKLFETEEDTKIADEDETLNEGIDAEESPSEEEEEESEDEEDEGRGSMEDEDMLSDEDLLNEDEGVDHGLNLNFDNDSDDEEDNFDEFIAKEGMEDSDEDEDDHVASKRQKRDVVIKPEEKEEASEDSENDNESKELPVNQKPDKTKRFRKTEVDSQFFRLRECEWVADNDYIGDNYDMDTEDIDLMEDIPDDDDNNEADLKYEDFFGNDVKDSQASEPKGEEERDDDSDDNEEQEDDIRRPDMQESDTDSSEDGAKEVTQLLGVKKKEEKSTFEKERERELMLMSTLEEDNIAEKPWFLKGEVVSADRPENSTLEEQLDYNIAQRQRPVVTEDTTTLVEKIIMNRIRAKAWDDVVRIIKPTNNPYEYKKRLLLNQDRSKKSLAQIYEEEYLKQHKKTVAKEAKELPEHKEIRERMDDLFNLLDALSNYHYTPKLSIAEVKVQSNLPAISVEEATPVTASDATLLAPQEILAPVQGELQGKSEFTSTDKKRKRRVKKAKQRAISKIEENRLQAKIKKSAGKGKKLDINTTVKFVEKAVKAGQVKMLGGEDKKAVKSSQAFFKKLQDTTKNPKSKGLEGAKKKNKQKKDGGLSASKLLL